MTFAVRLFGAFSLFLMIAACAQPVLVDQTRAQTLVVGNIDVDMSQFAGVRGREFPVPPEQVAADITQALRAVLDRPGTPNADVKLVVQQVALASAGQAFVLGGQSQIAGTLTVTDRSTGQVVVPPTQVTGISEQVRLGGVVGALTTPAAEKDYRQTLRGFAASIHQQLYGVKPADNDA